jgi:hypothetical protein
VGDPVFKYEQLQFMMEWLRFLPLGVVMQDPQLTCLAFQTFRRWQLNV